MNSDDIQKLNNCAVGDTVTVTTTYKRVANRPGHVGCHDCCLDGDICNHLCNQLEPKGHFVEVRDGE